MTNIPSSELNLQQEIHDSKPMTADEIKAAARASFKAMASLGKTGGGSLPYKASSPRGLVEAVMQAQGLTREEAEAELIRFGA